MNHIKASVLLFATLKDTNEMWQPRVYSEKTADKVMDCDLSKFDPLADRTRV